jgi:hypothetical protein
MVVACAALFFALGGSALAAFVVTSNSQIGPNTIYGANKPSTANDNIVDGSITSNDIKKQSIGSGRVTNNTLTGTQINESTLGRVPDAGGVAGVSADGFRRFQWTARAATSDCSVAQIWRECAPYTLTVPAGHHYVVTIISTINANPGNITGAQVLACPATDGPTCTDRTSPERSDFPANLFSSWTTSTTEDFFAGTYKFNTAMKWNVNVPANVEGQTKTTVLVYDVRMENIGG